MSGLLPRTPSGGQSGEFDSLNVQTLNVAVAGYINALTANSMSVGSLDVASVTTAVINGDPDLDIVTGTASVNGDDIVTSTATQTLTNKTLTSPVISTISNTGTLTLPTSTDTIVGRATTDTLTSKTIDSALNTITITSAPLAAQDINNVLNQAVRTGSAVTFGTVTTQSLLLSTAVNDAITVRSSTGQNNQILFQSSVPADQTGFGYDVLNGLHRGCWGYLNSPMVFATNNLERLRIPAGGIANDNTLTNILGLSGTTLAYKNDVVDLSTVQTLTNKTLTSPVINSPTLTNSGNTLTLPTTTDTLVGRVTTDTLTNKTLTSPVISTISNTGTLTLPTSTDTIVGRATTDSLSNKTFATGSCIFSDGVSRSIQFNPSGSASTTLELRQTLTANRNQTFPDVTGNIVVDSATQSLTNKDFPSGLSLFAAKVTCVRATVTTTDASTVTLVTIPIPTLNSYFIQSDLVAYCTAGPNVDQSCAQRFITRAQQVGGAITGGNLQNAFSNQFATNLFHVASGTDILVQITGIASDTIDWAVVTTVYRL